MLEAAHAIIKDVAKHLKLSEEELNKLLVANATHEFDITLNSGKILKAFRVQHNNKLGPYKGGVRFHTDVNKDEVTALATLMSLKTAAVGLPLGGGKGGVRVNPREHSPEEIEEIARKYVRGLVDYIGPNKDVPAPDVNTNAQIIDWMVDEYTKLTGDKTKASFTGKSINNNGSEGREAATGRGGVIALQEYLGLSMQADKPLTIAVQGVGNVGAYFGTLGPGVNKNWKLVAVTDSSGGVYVSGGIQMQDALDYKKTGNKLNTLKAKNAEIISNQDIIGLDVDVLVFAALGDVVNKINMNNVKAKIILELANGPLDEEAHAYLSKQGTIIIPDILANAGGVIVSHLEWLQNMADEHWTEPAVNQKLTEYIQKAMHSAYAYSTDQNLPLKEATIALAVTRIVE